VDQAAVDAFLLVLADAGEYQPVEISRAKLASE
jgi:hypothetical protein